MCTVNPSELEYFYSKQTQDLWPIQFCAHCPPYKYIDHSDDRKGLFPSSWFHETNSSTSDFFQAHKTYSSPLHHRRSPHALGTQMLLSAQLKMYNTVIQLQFTLPPSPPTRPIPLTISHSDRPIRTSFWGQELHKMQREINPACQRQWAGLCCIWGKNSFTPFLCPGKCELLSSHPVDATSSLEMFLNVFLSLFWANCCIWHEIMKHLMACTREITL